MNFLMGRKPTLECQSNYIL